MHAIQSVKVSAQGEYGVPQGLFEPLCESKEPFLVQEKPQAVQNERRGFGQRRLTAVPRGGGGTEHTYYTSAVSSRCHTCLILKSACAHQPCCQCHCRLELPIACWDVRCAIMRGLVKKAA